MKTIETRMWAEEEARGKGRCDLEGKKKSLLVREQLDDPLEEHYAEDDHCLDANDDPEDDLVGHDAHAKTI